MTDPSTTAPTEHTTEVLCDAIAERLSELEAWVSDSTDVERLVALIPRLNVLADIFKIVTGGVDSSLRAAVARGKGVVFLADGRTLAVENAPKRQLFPTAKAEIRGRIRDKALRSTEDMHSAIELAIQMTEEMYSSPSSDPKWTPLKALGYRSWTEISEDIEQTDKPGKVVIQ